KNAECLVINGLSDKHHPCQIRADLLTLIQYKKRLKGLKIAYVGDGNNVCNSLLIGCAKTGVDIAVARPLGYGPDPEAIKHAKEAGETSGASISIVEDPLEAVEAADAIYTDTLVSMYMEKAKETRLSTFIPI